VHWCSQQRGYPGIPLAQYSATDLEREYHTVKSCAPYCTINCVQKTAVIDESRENPREAIPRILSPPEQELRPEELPLSVRILSHMFVNGKRTLLSNVVLRLLGLEQMQPPRPPTKPREDSAAPGDALE
jgi:hypothetical protein